MIEKIEKFIKDNELTFEEGRRNIDLVVICGYTQYLYKDDKHTACGDVLSSLLAPKFKEDPELADEFNRVWNYTFTNKYFKWWNADSNRAKYVL